MPDIDHFGLFIAAGLLLNLTPGPDVLYIVTHALRAGARAGIVAALGITAGCFVHIVAAAVGVSALIAASSLAFTALKWLGAAYLLYVGAGMLLARHRKSPELIANNDQLMLGNSQKSLKNIGLQGFWTNALNPKVALFFLAFVPQFITSGAAHPSWAFLVLGLVFTVNGLGVNMAWALLAAWVAGPLGALDSALAGLQRAAGAMFIGFGLKLALTDNPVQ